MLIVQTNPISFELLVQGVHVSVEISVKVFLGQNGFYSQKLDYEILLKLGFVDIRLPSYRSLVCFSLHF